MKIGNVVLFAWEPMAHSETYFEAGWAPVPGRWGFGHLTIARYWWRNASGRRAGLHAGPELSWAPLTFAKPPTLWRVLCTWSITTDRSRAQRALSARTPIGMFTLSWLRRGR